MPKRNYPEHPPAQPPMIVPGEVIPDASTKRHQDQVPVSNVLGGDTDTDRPVRPHAPLYTGEHHEVGHAEGAQASEEAQNFIRGMANADDPAVFVGLIDEMTREELNAFRNYVNKPEVLDTVKDLGVSRTVLGRIESNLQKYGATDISSVEEVEKNGSPLGMRGLFGKVRGAVKGLRGNRDADAIDDTPREAPDAIPEVQPYHYSYSKDFMSDYRNGVIKVTDLNHNNITFTAAQNILKYNGAKLREWDKDYLEFLIGTFPQAYEQPDEPAPIPVGSERKIAPPVQGGLIERARALGDKIRGSAEEGGRKLVGNVLAHKRGVLLAAVGVGVLFLAAGSAADIGPSVGAGRVAGTAMDNGPQGGSGGSIVPSKEAAPPPSSGASNPHSQPPAPSETPKSGGNPDIAQPGNDREPHVTPEVRGSKGAEGPHDHLTNNPVPLEAYDARTGSGTLWSGQQEYAASLGYDEISNKQTQALTQALLDQNGITWDQARHIRIVDGNAFYQDHQIFQIQADEAKRILEAAKN